MLTESEIVSLSPKEKALLSPAEQKHFRKLWKELFEVPHEHLQIGLLSEFFWGRTGQRKAGDHKISKNIKKVFAHRFSEETVAAEWAYQYFEEEELLALLKDTFIGNDASFLARNRNLTHRVALAVLRSSRAPLITKRRFLTELPNSFWTKEFLDDYLTVVEEHRNSQSLGMSGKLYVPALVITHGRRLFELDESIPDSWVEKMVSGTPVYS